MARRGATPRTAVRQAARRRSAMLVVAAALAVLGILLAAVASSTPKQSAPPKTPVSSAGPSPQGCTSRTMPSGGTAALVGATVPVQGGGYVSDLSAWRALRPALRAQFEQELASASSHASSSASGCVQTTAALRVGVSGSGPSGSSARLVADASGGALPAGCGAGPHGTTSCDTLFGFGTGSTPFTVTGQVDYAGTPVCVTYGQGQLCSGWFGAWGADGTTNTGATGSGVGAAALGVTGAGRVRAQVASSPSALYFSHAPSGDSTSVTVTPYVTLLDVTVQSVPDSMQCAPTKVGFGVVTPNVSAPVSSQLLVSCVDESVFDGRRDGAARNSSPYRSLLAAQQVLRTGGDTSRSILQLVAAATAAHTTMATTSQRGLFTAGSPPVDSATVLAAACPALNAALAPGTRTADAFACTQSSIRPWTDTVLGQSLVSAQLTATSAIESSGRAGEAHLLLAFDTVEVHECWPAADCG